MKRIFESLATTLSLLFIGVIIFLSVRFFTYEESGITVLAPNDNSPTLTKESYLQTLEAYGIDKDVKLKDDRAQDVKEEIAIVAKPELSNDDIVSKIDKIVRESL